MPFPIPQHDAIRRIAILFEFGTLYGGERSMLAALDEFATWEPAQLPFECVAIAPETGALAAALKERGIAMLPLSFVDSAGQKLPQAQARALLAAAVEAAKPDLVHANSLSMGRLIGGCAPELRVPTSAHLRDIIKLSRAAVADLNGNRLLIAVSEATRRFHGEQGVDAGRMRVVYNGVDCREFCPRESSGALRRELGLPRDAFVFVTIGQIALRKGHDVLAAAAVIAADQLPDAHFVVAGGRASAKAESVAFERDFERRFASAGLSSHLHRLGYRADIPQLMNACDVLVHAARQEPLGRVLLESAASGLPILTTRVGGTEEILRDGESARLVAAGDPQALAAAMIELAGDRSLRQRYARQARQQVEGRFTISRAAADLAAAWNCV